MFPEQWDLPLCAARLRGADAAAVGKLLSSGGGGGISGGGGGSGEAKRPYDAGGLTPPVRSAAKASSSASSSTCKHICIVRRRAQRHKFQETCLLHMHMHFDIPTKLHVHLLPQTKRRATASAKPTSQLALARAQLEGMSETELWQHIAEAGRMAQRLAGAPFKTGFAHEALLGMRLTCLLVRVWWCVFSERSSGSVVTIQADVTITFCLRAGTNLVKDQATLKAAMLAARMTIIISNAIVIFQQSADVYQSCLQARRR